MGLERYVVDAVLIEKRRPTDTSASEQLTATNPSLCSWPALRSAS
jgi:hypothetical protein